MGTGFLQLSVTTGSGAIPIKNATVIVSQNGQRLHAIKTGENGTTPAVAITAPDKALTVDPYFEGERYAHVDVAVSAAGFKTKRIYGALVRDTRTKILSVFMIPRAQLNDSSEIEVHVPEHPLVAGAERSPDKNKTSARMPRTLPDVVIPRQIVVHLGKTTETQAQNVPVDFKYYIKNTCSHEIDCDWDDVACIEANLYCIISLALNRIYTEFYRSQGLPYDITSSTWTDQNYVHEDGYDDNIGEVADQVFNRYVRRLGHKDPYYTEYCDGEKVDCPGLKQRGSAVLAQQGYTAIQILRYYYGDDIEIAETNRIEDVEESYPGYTLTEGMNEPAVKTVQDSLNRIRVNYPSIPKIADPNGYYGPDTSAAVKAFKSAARWSLASDQTGNVDKATWYNISYAYYAVKKLAQLASEGEVIGVSRTPPATTIREGSRGTDVGRLQYLINVINDFYCDVPSDLQDYNFDQYTTASVKMFQKIFGLTQDGIVGPGTWQKLYEVYWRLRDDGLLNPGTDIPDPGTPGGLPAYPGSSLSLGASGEAVRQIQQCLNTIAQRYPSIGKLTADGAFGNATRNAVIAFQGLFGLTQDGVVGSATWRKITEECANTTDPSVPSTPGYPGYSIRIGASGSEVLQIQRCLNNIANSYPEIPKLTEDGHFGNATASAVIAFQQLFGLTQDGIVGQMTWAKLMAACQAGAAAAYPGYLISVGSSGDYVLQIQRCLNRLSTRYPAIPWLTEDGNFGNGTRSAVMAFQSAVGLSPDGIVGKATWDRLMRECAGSVAGMQAAKGAQRVNPMLAYALLQRARKYSKFL